MVFLFQVRNQTAQLTLERRKISSLIQLIKSKRVFLVNYKSRLASSLTKYCKFPNISPGLIEVRKHFWWAYILVGGGLYMEGLIFGRTFGLKGALCIPKNSALGVQSERLLTTFSS